MADDLDKVCFVIAPIGEPDSEDRKRSDQILKYVIKPIVSEFGFKPIRADAISKPGLITSQIIDHILNSGLVIADLTDHNPNVFYELALRHTIKKPFIQIIKEKQKIPFDVAGMRTIFLNHNDLDSVDLAKNDLREQIKTIIESGEESTVSPISYAIDLNSLFKTGKPEDRSLADILSGLSELKSLLSSIVSRDNSIELNTIYKIWNSKPSLRSYPAYVDFDTTKDNAKLALVSEIRTEGNEDDGCVQTVKKL